MMHQETLLYMYQQLDHKYKHKPNWIPAPITGPSHVQKNQIHIPAGKVVLGANFDEIEWGWDNEFSKSQVSPTSVYQILREQEQAPEKLFLFLERRSSFCLLLFGV